MSMPEFVFNNNVEEQTSSAPSPFPNPYGQDGPANIQEYLLPNQEKFGLYSDPFAKLKYIQPEQGVRNAAFWYENRISNNTLTEKEIKLIQYLSVVRVATRKQIENILYPLQNDHNQKTLEFLRKSKNSGFICSFSWISELPHERKKPMVYALTKVGAEAAKSLLPDSNCFFMKPVNYPPGSEPSMADYFADLIGGQLYSELKKIDRLISWERRATIMLSDSQAFSPFIRFQVIKEEKDLRLFWVEIFRMHPDWKTKTIQRFQKIEHAFKNTKSYERPERLIVVVDGDARIQPISEIAQMYMPSVDVRFTTDERLLAGLDTHTFISYDFAKKSLVKKRISYLLSGHTGMTATEYFDSMHGSLEEDYEE
ncbi:hypothetical protein PTI45_03317 [Paenibacillus nuruki]|uniref:Uncharacterized protein n=1 Tax=Paenibacillus nuruki TaxID=1886670 RepID=A0A1E3L0H5_9BACL|nr:MULTISPECIES: hypothetical protein [Paenibacillus]ODP27288.1 hypothetical protein PTI45_03317 [Paenibacillus nuruki]TKJ83848.1 hypothetical protein PaeCFBP13512_22265 [Paenibacillus sp. CFBP13512]